MNIVLCVVYGCLSLVLVAGIVLQKAHTSYTEASEKSPVHQALFPLLQECATSREALVCRQLVLSSMNQYSDAEKDRVVKDFEEITSFL